MCRLLTYNPAAVDEWQGGVPDELRHLGLQPFDPLDPHFGQQFGQSAARLPLDIQTAYSWTSGPLVYLGAKLAGASKLTELARYPLWSLLENVSYYGRLVLWREGGSYWAGSFGVRKMIASLEGATVPARLQTSDYLYHPEPGQIVQGRYCQTFSVRDPRLKYCACYLSSTHDNPYINRFRAEYLIALRQIAAQADVTFIDSDASFAEAGH